MINNNSIKKVDELFKQIYEPVTDGIVDVEQYNKAKYKILWVLKEANAPKGKWDLREFIKNDLLRYNNWRRTYKLIIYTTWGILNNFPEWKKQSRAWEEDKVKLLQQIAIINLKKIPGKSRSSDKEIQEEFDKNKNIIFSQIDTFEPDIIIFGGTAKYLNASDRDRIKKIKNCVVVSAYHPNARKSHKEYYKDVLDKIKEGA